DKYLKEIDIKENDKYIINYNTITESGQLEGIRGDKIMIRNSLSDEWKKIDAIICKSSMVLSKDNDYQALLSRGII
ncbi:sigma-E processing peptidase SpoIIGA, partial [Clostridium saudiense]|nr:sigma-E processing peptidase SpoIIGA [Clostridium saudiense]